MQDYRRVSSKRRVATRIRLSQLEPVVESAYRNYHAAAADVSELKALVLEEADRDKLRSNFSRLDKGQPCCDIREEILASTRSGLCPYCRLQEATTLDHIFEKHSFPEFSILRANLAPACAQCNSGKQANLNRREGQPPFHLYYDEFPTSQYLDVEIDVGQDGVRFRFFLLEGVAGVDERHAAALASHFQNSDLARRYEQRADSEMQDLGQSMRDVCEDRGPEGVSLFLRVLAKGVAARWSVADWNYVLLLRASESSNFCTDGIFRLGLSATMSAAP